MSLIETIEIDLEKGKSLDESLRANKIEIENLVLELIKENKKLNSRVDIINRWIEETMTPW